MLLCDRKRRTNSFTNEGSSFFHRHFYQCAVASIVYISMLLLFETNMKTNHELDCDCIFPIVISGLIYLQA